MRRYFLPFSVSVLIGFFFLLLPAINQNLFAHEGHHAATYRVTAADAYVEKGTHLRLQVLDEKSGRPIAARFTMKINSENYIPSTLGRHGLRFFTIHQRSKQNFTATYVRGTGDVLIPFPEDADSGTVTLTRGFEYVPLTVPFHRDKTGMVVKVRLRRWINMEKKGWHATDEHLHYERTAPDHDHDWLTMLDADGLSFAHFLVLKGGNLPGLWAQQYAYGKAGEASNGKQTIRPGEEYRDSTQGHVNLLGIEKIIEPISTGGLGEPRIPFNYPPLADVFRRTHELNGLCGPAHGGSLARSSTAVLDAVLGHTDFFEIANSHLYKTDIWYQLLNCGFIIPPVAGTDLPNFGFRDPWQPLLGEVRTYVRSGSGHNFDVWKKAVRRGETFITSGPIIQLKIDEAGPGGILHLPTQGKEVTIIAELAGHRPIKDFEIIIMGQPVSTRVKQSRTDGIYRMKIQQKLNVTKSCWIAARGTGEPKTAIEKGLGIRQNVIAHTGVIQVLVGDQPIRDNEEVEKLRKQLASQQEYYRTKALYKEAEHRLHFVGLFEEAIKKLE